MERAAEKRADSGAGQVFGQSGGQRGSEGWTGAACRDGLDAGHADVTAIVGDVVGAAKVPQLGLRRTVGRTEAQIRGG